jgi:glycosyltransferase involved in cell wall biosynthesis
MNRYVLVSGDFVTTGGMDRCNHALAAFLAGRGDDVHIVAHRASDDLTSLPNVTLHRVAKPLNSYLLAGPLLDRRGRAVARSLSSRGARVVVNGSNCDWPDVNWVHYVHAAATPTIATGGPARRIKAAVAGRIDLAGERRCIGRARLVIANSERTRRDLIGRLGIAPERVRTVYLGADVKRFGAVSDDERVAARRGLGLADDRPTVAFVGAMGDRRKGFDTLFDAWKIRAGGPSWDARLVVAGAGASLDEWRARVEAAGLAGSISFLGFRRDVEAVLAASDLLVSPTRYEPYGLNVHEALCRGLPAIVSRDAGVAEQFPEELSGLLLPDPDDAADLAGRLLDWRDRREALRRAVAPTAERLRRRDWPAVAREFVETIEGPAG